MSSIIDDLRSMQPECNCSGPRGEEGCWGSCDRAIQLRAIEVVGDLLEAARYMSGEFDTEDEHGPVHDGAVYAIKILRAAIAKADKKETLTTGGESVR